MMSALGLPAVTELREDFFAEREVTVSVLRLDMIHPFISGNKWYKLKYNFEEFFRLKKKALVTFGGAFSNHIVATAAAGKKYQINTIGIIRGNELNENSNPSLRFASQCGMKLFFVARDEYRRICKNENLPQWICDSLQIKNDGLYVIPEGGSNLPAVKGCAEIIQTIPFDFDFICCATGTGVTIAGISSALKPHQKAIGISILRGENFLEKNILDLNGNKNNFNLIHGYSAGGYARTSEALDVFCKNFSAKHLINIEPVYTGKMFFGLYDMIRKSYFKRRSKILAVHTGGVSDFAVMTSSQSSSV
jgi:1-aminocyclopropane-1-carboxylate deaminase